MYGGFLWCLVEGSSQQNNDIPNTKTNQIKSDVEFCNWQIYVMFQIMLRLINTLFGLFVALCNYYKIDKA